MTNPTCCPECGMFINVLTGECVNLCEPEPEPMSRQEWESIKGDEKYHAMVDEGLCYKWLNKKGGMKLTKN